MMGKTALFSRASARDARNQSVLESRGDSDRRGELIVG